MMADRWRDPYTPAEDAAILYARGHGLAILAEQWGRTQAALSSRRNKLRKTGAAPRMPLAELQPLYHRPPPPGPNFARPEFFVSENLSKIAMVRR
jgi:hypothetical protein